LTEGVRTGTLRQPLGLGFFLVAGSGECDFGEQVTGFCKTGLLVLFGFLNFAVAVAFAFGHGRFLFAPLGLFLVDAPDGKDGTGRVGKKATTDRSNIRDSVWLSGRSRDIGCGGWAAVLGADCSERRRSAAQENQPTPAI
jgi:hypothetical protein